MEAAAGLFVSARTVQRHLARIRRQLGVHSNVEAVVLAHDAGLLPTGRSQPA